MANVSVYNMEGSEVEKMDLNDNVFAVEVNEHLMHDGRADRRYDQGEAYLSGSDPEAGLTDR